MSPLLENYFAICRENPEVLVLMQVGGFYEAYGDDNEGSAKKLSRILNIHLTKKSGKLPLSRDNPYMCGLPTHAIQKHLTKLNDEGHEVMIYDQDAQDAKKRSLKGTYTYNMRMQFEEEEGSPDRRMFCVTLEKYPVKEGRLRKDRYLMASSYIEMNTGRVLLQETDEEDVDRALDEFLLTFQPEEVVLVLVHCSEEEEEHLHKLLKKSSCRVYGEKEKWTLAEEIHYFRTAFSIPEKEDDLIVHLGLHRHPLLVECLGRLLRVLRKHDPLLMEKLRVPEFMPSRHIMRFNQDALTELNVLSICERRRYAVEKKKQVSLLDMLSKGMNVMGKRSLEKMLRSPLCDAHEIQKRYQRFDNILDEQHPEKYPDMAHWLDVEWYLLRWKRGTLSLRLLGQLLQTYGRIAQHFPENCPLRLQVENTLECIAQEWDTDKMITTNGQEWHFLRNVPGYSLASESLQKVWNDMVLFTKRYAPEGKLERDDKRHVLQLRPKSWAGPGQGFYETHRTKSYLHISHPDLEKLSRQYTALETDIHKKGEEHFRSTSASFLQQCGTVLEAFNDVICRLSCEIPLARFFSEHGYVKPEVEMEGKSSWIECTDFRHPVMERIHSDALFVPYSCTLGLAESPRGMLIYGMNSSGKSTMLKSMGLCLWMAQCGMFVPATTMRFAPFDALYTKMGIQDNLFLGHSTFVAEMNELLYMLQRATPRSFIMCDELTSGTETQSATGIVVATLLHFLEKHLCFFLTTHLHTVSKIPEISQHQALRICHFRMDTNTEEILVKNIRMRYDRSLHEGSGNDLYGIEIAKAVGLPPEFLQQAFSYRDRVSVVVRDAQEKVQVSRYNRRFVLTECAVCGSKDRLQTHHITPQSEFKKQKIVHHAKDGLYNLLALCESCHETLHHPPPSSISST